MMLHGRADYCGIARVGSDSREIAQNPHRGACSSKIGLPESPRIDEHASVHSSPSPRFALQSCRGLHRLNAEMYLVRGLILEVLMRSACIVKTEVTRKRRFEFAQRLVGVQVNVLVLDAPPEPLDEHIGVSSQLSRLATIRADVFG